MSPIARRRPTGPQLPDRRSARNHLSMGYQKSSNTEPVRAEPSTSLVLSLSKERTVLRTGLSKPSLRTLRQAQGERKCAKAFTGCYLVQPPNLRTRARGPTRSLAAFTHLRDRFLRPYPPYRLFELRLRLHS